MLKKVSKKQILINAIFVVMPFGLVAGAIYHGVKRVKKRKE